MMGSDKYWRANPTPLSMPLFARRVGPFSQTVKLRVYQKVSSGQFARKPRLPREAHGLLKLNRAGSVLGDRQQGRLTGVYLPADIAQLDSYDINKWLSAQIGSKRATSLGRKFSNIR